MQKALGGFREGDAVRAKIIKIDSEKGKINFGIKPMYFDETEDDVDMPEAEEVDEDEDGSDSEDVLKLLSEGEDEDDEEVDEDGDEEEDERAEDGEEESDDDEAEVSAIIQQSLSSNVPVAEPGRSTWTRLRPVRPRRQSQRHQATRLLLP